MFLFYSFPSHTLLVAQLFTFLLKGLDESKNWCSTDFSIPSTSLILCSEHAIRIFQLCNAIVHPTWQKSHEEKMIVLTDFSYSLKR